LAITTAWNWWSSGGSECLSDVNAGAVAADFEQRGEHQYRDSL